MSNTSLPPPNPIASLVYAGLYRSAWLDKYPRTSALWRRAWRKSQTIFSGPAHARIHGRAVILNYGHTYPFFSRRFPALNSPLIELVAQAHAALGRPLALVDVGANIGDTVIMLEANCPGMIGRFYCVEGEDEFFAYLRQNVGGQPNVALIRALLSDEPGYAQQLRQIHPGTASAQGSGQAPARRLDAVLDEAGAAPVDILKVDVDGFDGKVLLGARRRLERDQPAVIFEWNPILCRQTGNSWIEHFEALAACGYRRFIWFTKFGDWSHVSEGVDRPALDLLAGICLNSRTYYDWHYDVVALPPGSPLSPLALAELNYARRRPSQF